MKGDVFQVHSSYRKLSRIIILLALVALSLSACNLGTTDPAGPATLQPRLTDQALPTLGYNTPDPDQNTGQGDVPTAAPPVGAYLYNTLNQVDELRMMNTINSLQGFSTRHVNSVQDSDTIGVGAARRYLEREFIQIEQESRGNFRTFSQPFTAYTSFGGGEQSSTQYNVIGVIMGTETNSPPIVIGAHYDSRTDDLSDNTAFAPGADDNGSGVAAILEMARIFSQTRPRTTLIFALFAAEEVNRQGSIAFLREYLQAYNIDVRLMINIDTIGSHNDALGNINADQIRVFSEGPDDNSISRQMARMIDFISDNHATDLEIVMEDQVDREGRYGDHITFSNAGIPAIRFIEALEDTPRREGRDTIEFVEPAYLRKSVRTIMTIIMALSEGLKAPQNPVVREMPDGTRRLAWEPVDGAKGYVVALRFQGDRTFEQVFYAESDQTRFDCDCFNAARYAGLAVAAINENDIMGPLSIEIALP